MVHRSTKRYYDVLLEMKASGIKAGVPLPPVQKRVFILPEGKHDPYHIMKRMIERNITDDEIRGYAANSRCMFAQWNGTRQRYVSDEGMVVTRSNNEWVFKTAWKKYDFDAEALKILKVLEKNGL